MKIINRYILEESRGPIVASVFIFTFIFLLDIMVAMMESIIVKGVSLINILRMLSFYVPAILTQTLPLGLFLGVMICFSKFTRSSETVAMVSIGLSIKKILKPVLAIALALSLFILFLQESIIPRSFVKLKFLGTKIAYENPVFQLKEKTFMNNLKDYSLYVDKVNKEGKAKDIIVFQKNKDGFPTVLVGREAYWKNSSIILKDSDFFAFDKEGKNNLKGSFKNKKIYLTAFFKNFKLKIKDVESLGIKELLKEMKEKKGTNRIKYKIEIYRKLALIFSTFPLAILGVGLTISHHRSSKKMVFSLAIAIIFSYVILQNMGIVLATSGKIYPFIGTWVPNFILYLIAYFVYRMKKLRGI
ncbi:MAG: permease [Fusobacteriales bacterium]|nr:MAG: permease [Fusobacteriales bacterium]